jgi:hypothetical protein
MSRIEAGAQRVPSPSEHVRAIFGAFDAKDVAALARDGDATPVYA